MIKNIYILGLDDAGNINWEKKNGCINTRLVNTELFPVSVTICILLQEGFALKTSPRNLRGNKLKVL